MATATKVPAAKKVAKKVVKKAAPVKEAVEESTESKKRGRQGDPERDAELTEQLMSLDLEIEGKFPNVRVKGIAAAAAEVGIDSVRAKGLIMRHLAAESGTIKKATAESVRKARMDDGYGWGAIEAMFGITKSQCHKLFDEAMGEEEAWRKYHLFGTGGSERIRPEIEKSAAGTGAKRGRKSKEDIEAMNPVFPEPDEVDVAELRKKLDGKAIHRRLKDKTGEVLGLEKNIIKPGSLKVSKANGAKPRSIQFVDDKGATRTVQIDSIVKLGR